MFSCDDMNDLAPAHTPAVFMSVYAIKTVAHRLHPILGRACQHLWLVPNDDAYSSSLVLGVSSSLVSLTALTLAATETASRRSPHQDNEETLSWQLPTRQLPVAPMPIDYCGRNRRFGL
jgi:hypothetical protein